VASLSMLQWLLIAAVVVLAFVVAGSVPRMLGDLRRQFSGGASGAPEQVTPHPSWTTICILLVVAIAVLAASALVNGTWAG